MPKEGRGGQEAEGQAAGGAGEPTGAAQPSGAEPKHVPYSLAVVLVFFALVLFVLRESEWWWSHIAFKHTSTGALLKRFSMCALRAPYWLLSACAASLHARAFVCFLCLVLLFCLRPSSFGLLLCVFLGWNALHVVLHVYDLAVR